MPEETIEVFSADADAVVRCRNSQAAVVASAECSRSTPVDAADTDTSAWLRLDLEHIINIKKTKLVFPTEGKWRYHIKVSVCETG